MAVDKRQFTQIVEQNLKADKTYKKFFINFTKEGKRTNRVLDYSDKDWDKRTRIAKAKAELVELKTKAANKESNLDENIKLDAFTELHFNTLPDTTWTLAKKRHYKNYITKSLGKKKVTDIKQMDIKKCIQEQEKEGLAPRTVKTTLELLNPLFKEAVANRLIDFNPCTGVKIKLPKTKKTVLSAKEELKNIYDALITTFKDDPFYLSMYLFALQGRRKSEILTLKWENLDFNNDQYILEDTKNSEHQTMYLPNIIKVELEKFKDTIGWVYESPINRGERINNIEKQTKKIKELVPNFTLHYMRNVITSAMGEDGISPTLMSGALGHSNTSTLAKYLSLNYKQGSKEADTTLGKLISQ